MAAKMTHRERVRAALNHQEPDRVPKDLSGAVGDAITSIAYRNLLQHLGMGDRPFNLDHKMTQTARVDEDMLRRFDIDFRSVGAGRTRRLDRQVALPATATRTSGASSADARPEASTTTWYPRAARFARWTPSAGLEQYALAGPLRPGPLPGPAGARRSGLHEETDYAVVLRANCAFFLRCAELRGWENFYIDLAGKPGVRRRR